MFAQGCISAGGGVCVLVDACGNVYGSGGLSGDKSTLKNFITQGKLPGIGASVGAGYAFPFPGSNAQQIYNGPSLSGSTGADGPFSGVGFSANSSGLLIFGQFGAKTPSLGISGARRLIKGGCGGNP